MNIMYGGTKEEMERLVKDAAKIDKSFKYNTKTVVKNKKAVTELDMSYADIVQAIHIVQTNMGITGTTAEEASKTISGSIGMLKSAWANLITGMGEGNEVKLDGLVNAVVDAGKTVFANIMPVAEKVIYGFIHLIEASVPVLLETVPGMVSRLAPRLVKAAGTLVTSIGKSLPSLMSSIVKKLPQALKSVERFIIVWVGGAMGRLLSNLAGYKIQTNQSIFQNLFTQLFDLLKKASGKIREFWKVVVQPIGQDIAKLLQGIVRAAIHLLDGLKPFWEEVSPKISEAFRAIADFWHNTLYPVLDDIVFFVITWLVPRIIEWVGKAVDFVGKAFKAIEQFWRDPLYPILKRIWVYISETVVPKAVEAWGIFRDKIKEVFDKISQWWDDSGKDLFDKVKKFITETLVEKMGEFYKNVLSPIVESLGGMEGIIDLLMKGIAGYIAAKSISTALGAIHGLITSITEGFIGLSAAIEAFAPKLIILAEIVALYQEIKQLLDTDKEYKKLYSGSRETVQKNLDEYKRLYETQGKEVADAYASAWVDVGKLDYNDSVRLLEYALEQQYTDIPKNLWEGFAKGWRYYFGGEGQKGVGLNQLVEDAFVNAIANIRILLGLDKDESESYIIAADIVEGFKTGLKGIKTWFEGLGEAILRRIKTIANVIIRGINTYILTPIENAINKIISGLNKIPGVALNDVTLGKISEFALEANYGLGRKGNERFFANGGILGEGQSAFVGEYAPELLRVIGGKAMVTPLSKVSARFPGGPETFEPRVAQSRPVTVIMQVGEKEFGRLAFELGSAEEQRVGVRLAKGGAY